MIEETRQSVDPADAPYGIPHVTRRDELQAYGYYSTGLEVFLRSENTGGQFLMMRTLAKPEDAPPFHVHTLEDEVWMIHEGRFRFWLGGTSLATATTYDVGPGDVLYGPRNVAHSFQSLDGTGDVTILFNSAQSQRYFLNVGEAEERQDLENLDSLEDIGVQVLDRAPVNGE